MQDEDVWVWIGVYPDEAKLYISSETGFLKDKYSNRIRHFKKKAQENNFEAVDYRYDKWDCEGYEKWQDLAILLKDRQDFSKQLKAVT